MDEPWNIKCVDILLDKLRETVKAMEEPFKDILDGQTEAYWRDLVLQKSLRLRRVWRQSRRRPGESEREWEERMAERRADADKKARQLSRRLLVRSPSA